MRLLHWMKREDSGLARTAIELAKYEEREGHTVTIREPQGEDYLYGEPMPRPDVHEVHSQLGPGTYYDGVPKVMWMHGEPISSVANGVSMRAIVDLAPVIDAFLCMRREEWAVWRSLKRTYLVPKGIDLERYRPLTPAPPKLAGEPAVLYYENWRGHRNPLYLCVAMQQVWQRLPKARLHLYNLKDKQMHETFKALAQGAKWATTFLRTLDGPAPDVNALLNRADIVVSCLYPLYARGIEAFGAGKAFIGPGYREPGYPYTCDLDPDSMATAIVRCWESYDAVNYRRWAEERHDVAETVRQSLEVYKRYL